MSFIQNDLLLEISNIETDLAQMQAYIDGLETQMSIHRTPSTRARRNSSASLHGDASVSNSDGGDDDQAVGGVKTPNHDSVQTSTPNTGPSRPDGPPTCRHIKDNPNRDGLGNYGTSNTDGQANKVNSSRQKEIKPATFDGKSSWIDFRSHFDICAELNDWSEQEKGLHLAVSLRGSAQSILGNLHGNSKKDFTSLCRALEERFAPANQTELYRAQLRERRQKATETIPELGQDIRRLTSLAYSSAPIDVRETLAKEQFIDALFSSDMRLRIKQSRPRDLNEAICLAVELDAFNIAEKRLHESSAFVRSAHAEASLKQVSSLEIMVSEMNKVLTELQSEVKDIKATRNIPLVTSDTRINAPRSRVTCFFCKKEGHLKKQCRKFKQWLNKQSKPAMADSSECGVSVGSTETLSKAGQGGLFVKADMYGYTINFLIDTGATVSLVGPHIYNLCAAQLGVPPVIDELGKPILTADMSPLNVKGTTKVSFAVKGMPFQHQMVVMSELDIDGILGLDFMKKYSCSIDIANELLLFQGQAVELVMRGKVGCYRVRSGDNLTLPNQSDIEGLSIESVRSKSPLLTRTLADVKTEVPFSVNPFKHDICSSSLCRSKMVKTKITKRTGARKCPMCNLITHGEAEFSEHITQCAMKEYECEVCNFTSTRESNVKRHMRRAHEGYSTPVVALGVADEDNPSCGKDPDDDLRNQLELSDDSGDESCSSLLEGRLFRKPTTPSMPATPKRRVSVESTSEEGLSTPKKGCPPRIKTEDKETQTDGKSSTIVFKTIKRYREGDIDVEEIEERTDIVYN